MSLLLDALKKAAEQKARKSKSSEADADSNADETLLDVAADVGARARPEEGSDAAAFGDETELDHSELSARLERSSVVRGSTDETAIDMGETTDARVEADRSPLHGEDDTGLEIPDSTQTGYTPAPAVDDDRDDTGLDIPETTETRLRTESTRQDSADETGINIPAEAAAGNDTSLSAQLQTGDDETMFITADDDTDLSQLGGEDLTGIGAHADGERDDRDETDLSQLGGEDLTGISDRSVGETMRLEREQVEAERATELWARDDTGIDVPDENVTGTDAREMGDDDETVLAEPFREPLRDGEAPGANDEDATDYRHPARSADEVEPADLPVQAGRESGIGDEDETLEPGRNVDNIQDEDLSLLLIEPDPTNPRGAAAGIADSEAADERQRAMHAAADELSLEDTTRNPAAPDQTDTQGPTITNPSQATAFSDDTRVAHGDSDTVSNLPPVDATSTRTYAPDNYDRTLMKLPSDDESKLFAGMKSDSDVIMTPDYAKKVFRSKTSAQRLQHYKVYLGIGLVILLGIGMYGGIQYQEESMAIDTSLMPLKRDPMPGLIKPRVEESGDLFAATESGATQRTIEIIQAAELGEEPLSGELGSAESADTSGAGLSGSTDAASAQTEPATEAAEPVASVATGTAQAEPVEAEEVTVVVEPESMAQPESVAQPESMAQSEPAAADSDGGELAFLSSSTSGQAADEPPAQSSSNLHILSSNQYHQNDIWLRDAYDAYLAGNDAEALRLYNQVLEVDPANRNALLARAAINAQSGNVDASVRDYQALLLLNPKDSLAMSSLLAVAEYSPREVETQLKLMIRDEPESPYLNFALANAYGAQNRWLEAQKYYFNALQNNPQDPNYAYNLAVSLEHISQPQSAATYYRRALENIDNGLATFNPDVVNQRLAVLGKP